MLKKHKIFEFLVLPVFLISFREVCVAGKGDLDAQLQGNSLKRKHKTDLTEKFLNLKRYKKSQDDQHHKLSVQSPYVKGDFCAQIRWVKDLNAYYGSKTPEKKVEIPATIHPTLGFIGNHLKACYELSHNRSAPTNKNILIPFVSFIGKRENSSREFFKGNYLKMQDDESLLAFISGPESSSIEEKYQQYLTYWNSIAKVNFLSPVKMIAGNAASELTGKDFDQLNDTCRQNGEKVPYQFHSEEWLHEMLGAHPQLAIDPITEELSPGDKIYAIVFDMYSFWDVCNHCQQNFKKALFQRETIKNFESLLDQENIRYPRNGLKVIFRVSSQRPYFSDVRYQHIKEAGGGYQEEEGFDIKTVNSSQVSLCTRPYPTYDKVASDVKSYFLNTTLKKAKTSSRKTKLRETDL